MRCPQCGEPVSGVNTRCSRCVPEKPGPSVGPMLSRANLARMRGQWNEAAERCIEVLGAEPRNATAHSLLGDIYQDQGRPEEARHWYQLALELNPGSQGDRAKLNRTEEILDARRQRSQWEAVIEGRCQPVATSLLVRESLQRIGALAGAALCGIFLVVATLVTVNDRSPIREGDAPSAVAGFLNRPRAVTVGETREEHELRRRLNEPPGGGPGQAFRVELDPRKRSANLRVVMSRSTGDRAGPAEFKERVMREGYRLALALARADDRINTVEVSVVGPPLPPRPADEITTLLVGTLSRENLVAEPEKLTRQELEQFYGAALPPYWAPELAAL